MWVIGGLWKRCLYEPNTVEWNVSSLGVVHNRLDCHIIYISLTMHVFIALDNRPERNGIWD